MNATGITLIQNMKLIIQVTVQVSHICLQRKRPILLKKCPAMHKFLNATKMPNLLNAKKYAWLSEHDEKCQSCFNTTTILNTYIYILKVLINNITAILYVKCLNDNQIQVHANACAITKFQVYAMQLP